MLLHRVLFTSLALALAGCGAPPQPPPSPPPPARSDPPSVARFQPPTLDAARRAKFDGLVSKLDALFEDDFRANRAPGMAVAIVVGGEPVYVKGFGLRDVEQRAPFDTDTPFPIASVTKGFTAMAILRLRDEGKIDLDAPAARYFPPIAKIAAATRDAPEITVRHLLTHASGMPEDNFWADVTENLSDADLARLLDGAQMTRPPGIRFEYSNVGWSILGRIVERVSGVPYEAYVTRAIFEPLGMTHTGWHVKDFAPGRVAVGYRGLDGAQDFEAPRVVAKTEELGVMSSAGGIITTARDLARYVSFQVSAWPPRDDLEVGPLRRSTVREMQQGVRSMDFGDLLPVLVRRQQPARAGVAGGHTYVYAPAYGFGLFAQRTCADEIQVEHSGGLPGYSTSMVMLPEKGFGIVGFLNDERSDSNATDRVVALLRAEGLLVESPVTAAPPLAAAPAALHDLLARWDDDRARAIFEPSFFRYQTIAALKERFAKLARVHGACHLDGSPQAVNRLRAKWGEVCDTGSITFAVAVAPGPTPRLQGMRIREDLPPSPALGRAAAAAVALVNHWDAKAAAALLATPGDLLKLQRGFAKLSATFGTCKLDRPLESDGKARAVFAADCSERPLEIIVDVDDKGKVTNVDASAARAPSSPYCAD